MKKLIIIILSLFTIEKTYSAGTVQIYCQSEHAKIKLTHSGFGQTLFVNTIAFGEEELHLPNGKLVMIGIDVYIDEKTKHYGLRRFYLKHIFTTFHGPSYPTPEFEIQMKFFGDQYHVVEIGTCHLY